MLVLDVHCEIDLNTMEKKCMMELHSIDWREIVAQKY